MNLQEYINYRLQRANESLEEALILSENEKWNAVTNRLYYACFYAVTALLLKNNNDVKSHDGARTQFGLQFVTTGKVDKKYGRFFTKLADLRYKGDYGDMFDHEKEVVEPLIELSKEFVNVITNLIKELK